MATIQEQFSGLASSLVGDCLDRLAGSHRLQPLQAPSALLIGRALTVKVAPGDNLYIHAALRDARPGDVLVVDGAGAMERALVGEILMRIAQTKGVLGFVVDGAVRDIDAFEQAEFPCYARNVTPRGPYKNGPGTINVPVSIDGCLVSPGDIVLGDRDGVVFIAAGEAEAVLIAARARLEKEQTVLTRIAAGTYDESWLNQALGQS